MRAGLGVVAEQWRAVVGYEGIYEVSNLGRVRSLDREVIERNARFGERRRVCRGRLLAERSHPQGYVAASLNRDGVTKYPLVHNLVLAAFVGPRPDGTEGCHWNGDRTDNALTNLRWGTPQSNAADKIRHGTYRRAADDRCIRGHFLRGPNLDRGKLNTGVRGCRACHRAHSAGARSAHRGQPWTAEQLLKVANEHYARILAEEDV